MKTAARNIKHFNILFAAYQDKVITVHCMKICWVLRKQWLIFSPKLFKHRYKITKISHVILLPWICKQLPATLLQGDYHNRCILSHSTSSVLLNPENFSYGQVSADNIHPYPVTPTNAMHKAVQLQTSGTKCPRMNLQVQVPPIFSI